MRQGNGGRSENQTCVCDFSKVVQRTDDVRVVPDNINFLMQLGVIEPMGMTDEEFPKS